MLSHAVAPHTLPSCRPDKATLLSLFKSRRVVYNGQTGEYIGSRVRQKGVQREKTQNRIGNRIQPLFHNGAADPHPVRVDSGEAGGICGLFTGDRRHIYDIFRADGAFRRIQKR